MKHKHYEKIVEWAKDPTRPVYGEFGTWTRVKPAWDPDSEYVVLRHEDHVLFKAWLRGELQEYTGHGWEDYRGEVPDLTSGAWRCKHWPSLQLGTGTVWRYDGKWVVDNDPEWLMDGVYIRVPPRYEELWAKHLNGAKIEEQNLGTWVETEVPNFSNPVRLVGRELEYWVGDTRTTVTADKVTIDGREV